MHREPPTASLRRAAPRRSAVALVAGLLVLGLVGGPAAAQVPPPTAATSSPDADPPKTKAEQEAADKALLETLALAPESPPAPDDPFVAVVEADDAVAKAAVDRLELTARSNDANVRSLTAVAALKRTQLREQAARNVRDHAERTLSIERRRLADLTVMAYVTGGSDQIDQYDALINGDTTDPAAGRRLMFGQVMDRQKQATEQAAAELDDARAKLRSVRKVLASAAVAADEAMSLATELTRRRSAAEQAHLEAIDEARAARDRLRAAAGRSIDLVSQDVPIIGLPRLTPEDLAGWFAQTPYHPRVTTPISDYAQWFIEEGRAEGIRGDIAFAQAVLETGGFANTDSVLGNNFSGIGHYDNLPLGWTFPSPRLGVRAQIQLLKSYAVKKPEYANPLVDKRLRGPAGCCQTWGDLTTVWATDPTYGPKVMLLYTSLVDYALKRRARGEGLDPVPVATP